LSDRSTVKTYLFYLIENKYRIILTYILTFIGSCLLLFYPYFTGIAIDGALNNNIANIFPLVICWIFHILVDGFRQIYDTRTFTRVFTGATCDLIRRGKATGLSTSELSARVNMMEELTWFLGSNLPDLLISILVPIGSLIVLVRTSFALSMGAGLLIVFSIFLNIFMLPKLKKGQNTINSLHEQSVSKIDKDNLVEIDAHYLSIGRLFIHISNLNAVSWIGVQLLGVVVVALGIWSVGQLPMITTGEAYSLVAYLWRVLEVAFSIPGFALQFARMSDIWRRISANV